MNECDCMTQRNNQAEDTPTADEKKRDVVKVHKDLDIRPPKFIRNELYAKVFKPGDRVKFSGKIGKNGNVLLSIEKVE